MPFLIYAHFFRSTTRAYNKGWMYFNLDLFGLAHLYVLVQEYYHNSNVTKVVNFFSYGVFFLVYVCLLLMTLYSIFSCELFICMFVGNFEFNGVLAVSRIIENVHIVRGIAVEDCSVVRIFMFLKVFCGSTVYQ